MNESSSQLFALDWPFPVPTLYANIMMIITIVLSPIMVIFNLFLIHAINKVQSRKSTTDKLMVCMSASDAICGGTVFPLLAFMLKSVKMQQNRIFQEALQYLAYILGYMSFFLLIAIALDRYLHLIKLNRYNEFMNEFRFRLMVSAIFIVSNSLALVKFFVKSFYLQVAMNAMNIIGITSIFGMYYSILRSILSHGKTMALKNTSLKNTENSHSMDLENNENSSESASNKKVQKQAENETEQKEGRKRAGGTELAVTKIDGNCTEDRGIEMQTNSVSLPQQKIESKRKLTASRKRDEAVIRTILILLFTVFVLYNPYNVMSTMWTYYRYKKGVDPGVLLNALTFASYIVLFCNGIANVLILANSNAKLRNYIAHRLSKCFLNSKSNVVQSSN